MCEGRGEQGGGGKKTATSYDKQSTRPPPTLAHPTPAKHGPLKNVQRNEVGSSTISGRCRGSSGIALGPLAEAAVPAGCDGLLLGGLTTPRLREV